MNRHVLLFHSIAPLYRLFFNFQLRRYRKFLKHLEHVGLPACNKVLDIGFGTGALLKALDEKNITATGVDGAKNMVKTARKKLKKTNIDLFQADIEKGFAFEDKTFDCVFSCYVVHGLNKNLRRQYYKEAKRLAKHRVILYEHSNKPSLLIKIAELLEGGEYFSFKAVKLAEFNEHFRDVTSIQMNRNVTIHILKP